MTLADRTIAASAVALIVLMLTIVAQVVFTALDVNPVAVFAGEIPLFGDAITLNSLLDFQWHLLVLTGLLPAGIVWLRDAHVRVDFLYEARTDKAKARIDLVGNLLFAAPFLALAIPAAIDFASRAWRADEGSRNGGLNDLWLIKFVLPLGLSLLALAVVRDLHRLVRNVR